MTLVGERAFRYTDMRKDLCTLERLMSIDRPPVPYQRSAIRRFFSALMFRVLPVLLLLAVLCSGYFLINALIRQTNDSNELAGRRDAYRGTATALAASENVNRP